MILAQLLLAGLLGSADPTGDRRLEQRPEYTAALDWRRWAQERSLSLPALAIQFGLRNPKLGCALVGAKAAHEVEENVAAVAQPIPEEVWHEVEQRVASGVGQTKLLPS